MERKTRLSDIHKKYVNGEKLVSVTAYDFTFASLLDKAGVDILLVGDSLGSVIQGLESTLPVTLDEMIYHTKAVQRAAPTALVVTDLPFLSYQVSVEEALRSAGRIMKESGGEAVKLEGGRRILETVSALVESGIPVMGHLGLTPQTVHQLGGYRIQGKSPERAKEIIEDAMALADAGAFAIVLEGVPSEVAKEVTQAIEIPTIGIGAGADCSGQVLVSYDLLGLFPSEESRVPKFVKKYSELSSIVIESTRRFADEVRSAEFPSKEYSYSSPSLSEKDSGRSK